MYHGKLGEDARKKTGQECELMDGGREEHTFSCAMWRLIDLQEAVVL